MLRKSQGKNKVKLVCFLCGSTSSTLLCKNCMDNPFLVEDARTKAARLEEIEIFKDLYGKQYATIENKNTKGFWDKSFSKELSLKDQDSMTKKKIDKLISFIPAKKTKLLDLGFGQGYIEERVLTKKLPIEITGIDISEAAVKKARKKFKGNFLEGDVLQAKNILKKQTFDIITAIELIEHISPRNIFTFFNDVRNLLNVDGYFLISTPLNEGLRNTSENPSGHVRDYSIETLKKELELSGFKLAEIHTFYAFNKNYLLKNFLSKIFKNRWEPNNVVIKAVKV